MDTRRLLGTLAAGTLLTAGVAGAPLIGATQLGDMARHVAVVQQDQQEDEREGTDEAITGDALDRASAAALEYLGEGRVTDTEVGDEEGAYEVEVTLDDGSEVDVHLDENFEVLSEEIDRNEDGDEDEFGIIRLIPFIGSDEDEQEDAQEGADEAITGDALDRASEAALEYVGQGRVTDTEVGDEEGAYEVEVTLDDGSQVDVHLDENFEVLSDEVDRNEDGD